MYYILACPIICCYIQNKTSKIEIANKRQKDDDVGLLRSNKKPKLRHQDGSSSDEERDDLHLSDIAAAPEELRDPRVASEELREPRVLTTFSPDPVLVSTVDTNDTTTTTIAPNLELSVP